MTRSQLLAALLALAVSTTVVAAPAWTVISNAAISTKAAKAPKAAKQPKEVKPTEPVKELKIPKRKKVVIN